MIVTNKNMCMQIKNGNKFGEGSHRMIINKKRFSKIRKGSHRFLQMIIGKKKILTDDHE